MEIEERNIRQFKLVFADLSGELDMTHVARIFERELEDVEGWVTYIDSIYVHPVNKWLALQRIERKIGPLLEKLKTT